jgi:hypothetical protein
MGRAAIFSAAGAGRKRPPPVADFGRANAWARSDRCASGAGKQSQYMVRRREQVPESSRNRYSFRRFTGLCKDSADRAMCFVPCCAASTTAKDRRSVLLDTESGAEPA